MQFIFEIPKVKFGVLILKDITVKPSTEEFLSFEQETFSQIRKKYSLDNLRGDKIIQSFRKLYWEHDMDPTKIRIASEAVVRRILKGENLWRVNNLVDCINNASAQSLLPMGLYDIGKLKPPITVRNAEPSEIFAKIGGGRTVCNGNEIVVSDSEKIIDYGYATADSDLTKADDNTTDALVLIFATEEISKEYLLSTLEKTASLVTKFCGGRTAEKKIVCNH